MSNIRFTSFTKFAKVRLNEDTSNDELDEEHITHSEHDDGHDHDSLDHAPLIPSNPTTSHDSHDHATNPIPLHPIRSIDNYHHGHIHELEHSHDPVINPMIPLHPTRSLDNIYHHGHHHAYEHEHDSHGPTINPMIPLNPTKSSDNYKHIRPLSPTPVDSIMSRESYSIIQPLKGTSWLFLNHPTQSFTSKQLCDYIEMIVLRHYQTNETTHDSNHTKRLHSIRETLSKLRSLLITEHDHHEFHFDDEKLSSHPLAIIGEKSHPNALPSRIKYDKKVDEKPEPPLISKKTKWCTHSSRNLWKKFVPSSALLHDSLYSIDVKKHCGILRGSVRQDWNTIETERDEERNWEELKPHWFELFFDLMFVAAIVHISTEVADAYEHHNYMFIVTVFPQFGLLILCWLEQALYHSRFRMTQMHDGLLRFIYMAFVLLMGLSIGNSDYMTSQKLFLIAYMFTKLIMCIMFIKSAFIPRAFNHSIYMIIENGISIVTVILLEIFVNIHENQYEERRWVWTVIYCALFIYSWFHMAVMVYLRCIRDLGINIPINVPHIAERMGAFVLIILGETIISIMVQHVESTRNGIILAYTVTMSFFVIVYCIGKLYFGSQPSEHELHHHKKSHAMSTSVWRARVYKWFHILLFFGLLGLGLGSKITIHELPDYHGDKPVYVFLPGISCIIICICINIIRLTHPFDYSEKHPHMVIGVWLTRIICIVVMLGVLFTWKIVSHFVILGVYVACFIIQIFVDFESKTRLIITKEVEKKKSEKFHQLMPKGKLIFNSPDGSAEKREHTITTREISFIGTF